MLCWSPLFFAKIKPMALDLRSTYRLSEEYARVAVIALFSLVGAALLLSIFVSPSIVLAIVVGVVTVVMTFFRPTWTLGFLLVYLPFEPFLLKWVPDDIYVYARFFSEILVYLIVFSTLWKLIVRDVQAKQTVVDIPFVLFIVVILASALINAVEPFNAALGLRQIIRFMLLFFATVYLAPSKRWIQIVLSSLFLILAIQIVLGISQAIVGQPLDTFLLPSERRTFGEITLTEGTVQFWDPGQRVFGTLGRYDRLGTFMAFLMIIIVSMLYEPKMRAKYGRYLTPLLIAAVPALVLTYSRSAWFGFVLGALFIALWAKRDKRVLWATGLVVATMFVYLSVTGLVVNRLIDVSDQSVTERFFEAFSAERWRGEYYGLGRVFWMVQTLTAVVPASPVFGHGPATYGGGAVAALSNTTVYDELGLPFGVYGTEGYIDNNWFSLWGEAGTLGLGMYLWLYIGLFLLCVKVWRNSKNPQTRALALGVAGAMIAVGLNGFLATFLEVRTLAAYLWVFAGVIVVLAYREKILT